MRSPPYWKWDADDDEVRRAVNSSRNILSKSGRAAGEGGNEEERYFPKSHWVLIRIGNGSQKTIHLSSRARHFGGCHWYYICPVTGRRASVLWRPNGASRFASRHAWPGRIDRNA